MLRCEIRVDQFLIWKFGKGGKNFAPKLVQHQNFTMCAKQQKKCHYVFGIAFNTDHNFHLPFWKCRKNWGSSKILQMVPNNLRNASCTQNCLLRYSLVPKCNFFLKKAKTDPALPNLGQHQNFARCAAQSKDNVWK